MMVPAIRLRVKLSRPSEGDVVRSPADAWVAYAGPFRSYGQVVILDTQEKDIIWFLPEWKLSRSKPANSCFQASLWPPWEDKICRLGGFDAGLGASNALH
jgi:hypothetical protein